MIRRASLALSKRRFATKTGHTPLALAVVFSIGAWMAGCGRPADQASGIEQAPILQPDILGKVIHFNSSHEAEPYKVSGWSGTETSFTWTEGKAAVLALPLPDNSQGVRLRMWIAAYVHPPELNSQPVEVYANGQKVADWDVTVPAQNTADIPKELTTKSTTLTIQLRMPKAVAPATFMPKGDLRVLGICCNELELTRLPLP